MTVRRQGGGWEGRSRRTQGRRNEPLGTGSANDTTLEEVVRCGWPPKSAGERPIEEASATLQGNKVVEPAIDRVPGRGTMLTLTGPSPMGEGVGRDGQTRGGKVVVMSTGALRGGGEGGQALVR